MFKNLVNASNGFSSEKKFLLLEYAVYHEI